MDPNASTLDSGPAITCEGGKNVFFLINMGLMLQANAILLNAVIAQRIGFV